MACHAKQRSGRTLLHRNRHYRLGKSSKNGLKPLPYTFRNPLYHWTHLETEDCFRHRQDSESVYCPRKLFDECNAKLATPEYSARNLMRRYHVETVCTTDDPVDSLEYHIATRESGFEIKMLPTWRPDKAMAVEVPAEFRAYVEKAGRSKRCQHL